MIKIGTIEEMDKYTGEKWMIVRSPDKVIPYAKHVPELSPSPKLFRHYREIWHKGEFNQEFFDTVYVPWFLRDISQNKEAISLLQYLCEETRTKDYYLCCYCKDEALCHRSIIAGLLLGMGAEINTKERYRKYYSELKGLMSNAINHGCSNIK